MVFRIVPHRIEHFPREVLNVVLSNHAGDGHVIFSAESPSQKDSTLPGASINNDFSGTPNSNDILSTPTWTNLSIGVEEESSTMLAVKQGVNRVPHKIIESNVEQHIDASLPSDVQARACISMNKTDEEKERANRIMDLVSKNRELATLVSNLQDTINAKQDEMKQLQIQASDRLALFRFNVKSLLERTYELHDSPIPRLFIVLPADSSSWNPDNLFSNKFRIRFLCECGEHTKSANSKFPCHIHLTNHEGYDIINPRKFFQKYGFHVLTILRMLKFGISEAGIVVPAVSLLVPGDATQEATSSWRMSIGNIELEMDQVIHCIEHVSANEGVVNGRSNQTGNNKVLENSDLRQLETFLERDYSYKTLGNLFRTVTTEGHVKWVCGDHFRENYDQEAANAFRDAAACLCGLFDESMGLVERLRDTITKTNVGVLELYLSQHDGPTKDILNRGRRYDPIFDIMAHHSIQSVKITGTSKDFFKRSNLQSCRGHFPNVRHLGLGLRHLKQDLSGIKTLVDKSPNLSRLTITCYEGYKTHGLHIVSPMDGLPQSTAEIKSLSDLLKVFGGLIETAELTKDWLDDAAIANFAKAIENGSRLKELILESSDTLGEYRIKDLASIVARSELRKLDIHLDDEAERVHILGSIQWEHLRELSVEMSQRGMATRVMRTLVDGVKKVSGKVPLKEFQLTLTSLDPILGTQDELLSSFIASTSLKKLRLDVTVPHERMLSLFISTGLSQLQSLFLRTEDLYSNQVETLLDYLQDAAMLRELTLWGTEVTVDQIERMRGKATLGLPPESLAPFTSFLNTTCLVAIEVMDETTQPSTAIAPVMSLTQSFRLVGVSDIREIHCSQVDGIDVIFWEDIEHVFPGFRSVKSGNITISPMRDSSGNRAVPHRIEHFPGEVLNVILSNHAEAGPVTFPETPSQKDSSLPGASIDDQKQLQIQALDRLALFRNNVKELLEQTYDLYESPIPRLFIVLPAESSSWNPVNLFSNKFRIYFLCECRDHTKPTDSNIPHHIHLTNHKGYDIINPKKFFRRYGSHLLTILRMLKFGISEAGIVVPAVSLLVPGDATHEATPSLRMSIGNIELGIDQVIHCIERVSANEGVVNGNFNQTQNSKISEDSDLRQLETFLKRNYSHKTLGNLFRTVTTEGHVKWVCGDHFRETYDQEVSKAFRKVVEGFLGSYYENIGRTNMILYTRKHADRFYPILEKARSVHELHLILGWKTTHNDLKRLRDTITKTNVGVLDLYLRQHDGPTKDILNRGRRYDPIFDIMAHHSIQSVKITGTPKDFFKRSNLQSRKTDFPNLKLIELDINYLKQNLYGIKTLIDKSPNLSRLTITCYDGFYAHGLRISPEMGGLPHSTAEIKSLSDLLKVFGRLIETAELTKDWLDDSAIANFAKAIENGSRLKELTLESSDDLGEHRIKGLASIVARSELRKLDIHLDDEAERVHILGSIQWEHLRELSVEMSQRGMATRVMRTLVDGVKKVSGKVPLKEFQLTLTSLDPILGTQDELLSSFIASTSLKKLRLDVTVPHERMLSLFISTGLSRLQSLFLRTEDLDSNQVETLLEYLQDVTVLRELTLWGAEATVDQIERMSWKGITLHGL
ncbi:MAG: hypothetical protein J3Q66DRAFT_400763 [Benniella sp.]|nr:MAG: hypothetical protein J3Q66DRAFT_400763 [Benniella sp.]